MEVVGYYVKELENSTAINFRAPCFLIEIIGVHMIVSVFANNHVHVDHLIGLFSSPFKSLQ